MMPVCLRWRRLGSEGGANGYLHIRLLRNIRNVRLRLTCGHQSGDYFTVPTTVLFLTFILPYDTELNEDLNAYSPAMR